MEERALGEGKRPKTAGTTQRNHASDPGFTTGKKGQKASASGSSLRTQGHGGLCSPALQLGCHHLYPPHSEVSV